MPVLRLNSSLAIRWGLAVFWAIFWLNIVGKK
jgi:hypothetical protein